MRRVLLSIIAIASALMMGGMDAHAKKEKTSVMSFNIRLQFPADTGKYNWESRKNGCVKAIRKYSPDILGLQEASFGQKLFMMNSLQRYIMIDGSAKPGTVNEKTESAFNPIFFRTDRFELLDYGSFWLNEDQTSGEKGWDAGYARTAGWVKLRFRKSGQIIFFFNTHFDNTGTEARRESSSLVAGRIKEIAGDNAVVFLTGDLNATSEDKALRPLKAYLKESAKTVKKADTTPSFNDFGRKGAKPQRIDHIFHRNAEARTFSVVSERKYGVEFISDHYPVYSEFVIHLPKD